MKTLKQLDLGQRFGDWECMGKFIYTKSEACNTYRRELCKCKCGKEKYVLRTHLLHGASKNCGCNISYRNKNNGYKRETHGLSGTRFYHTYDHIKARCNNKNIRSYKYYGGRGIKCLWSTFEEFKNDMYNSYVESVTLFGEKQTTIDRIDSNGNYCKDNCRWTNYKNQGNNKTNNLYVNYNGQKITLTELCEKKGIDYSMAVCRYKAGKTLDHILNVPSKRKLIEYKGEKHLVSDWAKILGIPYSMLKCRLSNGWDVEKAFETPRKINQFI